MYDWRETLLSPMDTLEKAIHVLEREALRIVMVADEHGHLLGTVTDGDVRRALIKHHSINTPLSDAMFKGPTTASVYDDREKILDMMKSKGLLQVPIVDSKGIIVGLETLEHLLHKDRFNNPVFLMAGGFGKRLRPLTNDIPKPLLKVGNKPILETILNQFIAMGFHNFFISTHYKAEMVRAHFGDGEQWGVDIQYVHEEKPLGTAGALGLLPDVSPDMPIIMANGDLLTKVNFDRLLQFHQEQGGTATMCVRSYDLQVPYGVVESEDGRIKSIVEKPIHNFFVNAGIYVLNPSLLEMIDGHNYLDMPSFLELRIDAGDQIGMFPVHEYWLDIGRMEEYERAQCDIDGDFR